jgi:hypothetical protein
MGTLVATAILLLCISDSALAFTITDNHKGKKLGGYQTLVAEQKGHIVLGFGVIHHGGKYRLCVEDPDAQTTCHQLRLKFSADSGAFLSLIYWSKRFPSAGAGHYTASWFKSGQRMGPKLAFDIN